MDVLIVYGTTEGQTRKIADWTARRVREREHHVELRDSTAPMSDLNLETFRRGVGSSAVPSRHRYKLRHCASQAAKRGTLSLRICQSVCGVRR